MKNSEFKVGSVVVVDCSHPTIKYEVIRQEKDGMYVKVHKDFRDVKPEYGPYDDNRLKFKLDPHTKQFFPEPGDTIVCENGVEFICCTEEDYINSGGWNKNRAIYGFLKNGKGKQSWINYRGEVNRNDRNDRDYEIEKIIPAEKKNLEVCLKVDVKNLDEVQSKLRTLELENLFLRTLLRKQGVDI